MTRGTAALVALVVSACGRQSAPPTTATETASVPTATSEVPTVAPATTTPKAPEPEPARPEPITSRAANAPQARLVLRREGAAGGPVAGQMRLAVAEATLDPADPGAARIVLALELATLSTGDVERDEMVKGPDFIDVTTNAVATLTITRLVAAGEVDAFDGTASLMLRGVSKDVPIALRIVERRADGALVIEAEARGLARAGWGLGSSLTVNGRSLELDATMDLSVRAELAAPPIAPAQGTATEVYARMARHQSAVLDLIEAKKDDPEAAAEAIEDYAAKHESELASLALALNRLRPEELDALLRTNEVELKRVMQRGARVMGDNPALQQNERFRRAMDTLGSVGDGP